MLTDELIKSGNTFTIRFLLVFAFVYFIVVTPYFNQDQTLDSRIKRGEQQIENIEKRLTLALREPEAPITSSATDRGRSEDKVLDRYLSQIGKTQISRAGVMRGSNIKSFPPTQEKLVEKEIQLREGLVRAESDYVNFEKSKPKKEFTLPFVPSAIPEEIILALFPAMSIGGLWRILKYRRDLFLRLRSSPKTLPPWVTPVPYHVLRFSFWKWCMTNLIGFAMVGSVALLVFTFLLRYTANESKLVYPAIYNPALLATLLYYFVLTVRAIFSHHVHLHNK